VNWLIFVDDLHVQFTTTGYLLRLVRAIATDLVRDGEAFIVAASGGNSVGVERTADRDRLSVFAKHVSGAALAPKDVIGVARMNREVQLREDMAVNAVFGILDAVHEEHGRRRVLVVISNGWPSGSEGQTVQVMTSLAKAQVIPVITIDPQQFVPVKQPIAAVDPEVAALRATMTASLRAVSERTGGLALLESRNITEVVRRARTVVRP
jgi:hypothetical protein